MNRRCLVIVAAVLVMATGALAQPGRWVERFDSRVNIDTVATTALVDTVASMLKLHPFRMELSGAADTPGEAFRTEIWGDYAYVAGFSAGLSVIDISNPAAPVNVWNSIAFDAADVAVSGEHLYVAGVELGLVVFDISSPASPSAVGGADTPGECFGVAVDGDFVYIADTDSGLVSYDVSDPTDPQKMWTIGSPAILYTAVDAQGAVVYVADNEGGLESFDVTERDDPLSMDYLDLPGNPIGLDVDGPVAYVANEDNGLQMVLVAVPWALELMETHRVGEGALHVTADRNVIYAVAPGNGLYAMRFDENESYVLVDSVQTAASPLGVVVAGEYAYVADEAAGLRAVRVAAPLSPPIHGPVVDTPGSVVSTRVDGFILYVADGLAGMRVYDASSPEGPSYMGGVDTPGFAMGVYARGPLVYIADQSAGVHMVDMSDFMNPQIAVTYDTPSSAHMVDVSGSFAYVADGDSGLVIVDFNDITNPVGAGVYQTPDNATDVEVHGDLAYVASLNGGLQIVDVSDPYTPTLAGAYAGPGSFAVGLTVSGNYCYLGNDYYGVRIVDVTDPSAPTLVTDYDTPGFARDVAISGDLAVVTDDANGILVLDVTNPAVPLLHGSIATANRTRHLDISGDVAYVSNGSAGVVVAQVFDRKFNLDENAGQGVVVATSGEVTHVRLTAAVTDSVRFEVSADNGGNWTAVTPDQQWQPLTVTGSQLVWRASLYHAEFGYVPACDSLLIEYGDLVPILVQEIQADVSDGGVVLHWDLSADEAIEGFRIYRRETAGGTPEVAVNSVLLRPDARSFADRTAVPGRGYSYTLGVVKPDGSEVRSRAVSVVTGPLQAALEQNHPNPFNPATTISYVVPRPMNVEVAVYSLEGKLVRRLVDGPVAAGAREVHWDGTNERGQRVASGVYFCRYTAGKFTQTRKMLLLK